MILTFHSWEKKHTNGHELRCKKTIIDSFSSNKSWPRTREQLPKTLQNSNAIKAIKEFKLDRVCGSAYLYWLYYKHGLYFGKFICFTAIRLVAALKYVYSLLNVQIVVPFDQHPLGWFIFPITNRNKLLIARDYIISHFVYCCLCAYCSCTRMHSLYFPKIEYRFVCILRKFEN